MEEQNVVLTSEQQLFARRQFTRWLGVRLQHEEGAGRTVAENGRISSQDVRQLMIDIEHSSLLLRLLSGKEPLENPPPLDHAYPVYPD